MRAFWFRTAALCLGTLILPGRANDAAIISGRADRTFSAVLEYFPGGNPKTVVEGKSARPLAGGVYEISQLRLTSYETEGGTNLVVEAPRCTYHSRQKTASSPGPVICWSGDDRFRLQGEGFLWQEASSQLIISNKVHTRVGGGLLFPRSTR